MQVALASQPPLLVRHSSTSVQVSPSPVKPALQAQVRLPGVLVQVAFALQPPLPEAHSLTSTQVSPARMKPIAQATPQLEALQVAAPFTGEGQAEQIAPQELTSALDTHCCPQACWPAGQAQVAVAVLQVAPGGHSASSRQPGLQVRVMGSQ